MPVPEDTLPADIGLAQLRTKVHGRLFGSQLEPVRIGRYEVREYLGSGGMGVVYSAWDPELDRAVAIKLLRSERLEETARARLRREAKALAKLSHPNVVHVYEVGSDAGRVFVAMEYVEGETLAQWLEDATRDVDAILRMFVAVGRGLGAAHEAGFVHRDFKPDNVLIDGSGRPRVVDFGLVLGPQDRATTLPSTPAVEGEAPLSLTATGTLVGTPAYMAPEQHRGQTADARTDIFAYCVALFEALYGLRPFGGDTYQVLAASVLRGDLRTPPPEKAYRVPRRIRHAVARGLACDPADRFASMDALLDALTPKPPSRARAVWFGVAAAAVVGAFTLGVLKQPPDSPAGGEVEGGAVCEAASAKLAGVWDDDVRARVRQAFVATEQAFADASLGQVEANLEAWSARWIDGWGAACESALGADADAAELGMRRMRCLEVRLAEVRQLTEVFVDADADVVRNAAEASAGIADVSSCDDAWAAAPQPPTDESRAIDLQLARATGLLAAGREADAARLAEEAQSAAREIAREDLRARAMLLGVRAGGAEDPIRTLHEVVALARDAADRRTEAEGWIEMIAHAARVREDDGEPVPPPEVPAAAWADMAQRLLDRDPDPRLQLALHVNLARFYREHDALDSARERLDLAQKIDVAAASIAGARLETALGQIEVRAGREQLAARHFREASRRLRKSVGAAHPDTMFADYMLATVTDDPEEAAALSRQVYAMSVARRGFDKDNFEQTIGALELMRKIHRRQRCEADDCPDPVSEAELEVVLAEAGAQEAKALAKATRRLVARKGEDATVVLGDGVAIEVDGEHTKITVDTSKVRWPIPGCKPGSKCTFDTAARAVPPPPKPPAAPKIPPPAISP